jgi:hypothetical protein
MKKLMIAALVAGQVLTSATPALAADLTGSQEVQGGAFGGLRLRVPLGGRPGEHRVRAGFALAPTVSSRARDGAVRTRIAEGLEFGYRSGHPLSFSIAGRDLQPRRLGAAQDNDDNHRHRGPSTLGWIAIGLGAAVVIVVGAAALCASDHNCIPGE